MHSSNSRAYIRTGRFSLLPRTVRFALALLLAGGFASTSLAQQDSLNGAIADYLAGNGAKALPILDRYAQRGDRTAIFFVGRAFYEGNGVAADINRAATEFAKATQLGDVNAPVWAGQAYEVAGGYEKAAAFHRTALERAPHTTSMLALARFHRRDFVAGSSQIASARYSASTQAVMDSLGVAVAKQDYLAPYSCFELIQAAFVEERSANPGSKLRFNDLTGDFLACTATGSRTPLMSRLVSAAALRLKQQGNGTLDEKATIFAFLDARPDPRRFLLPSVFKGMVAFASDADSDEVTSSLSGHRFLNDHLGLPIASSVFPMAIPGRMFPVTAPAADALFTGFFSTVTGLDNGLVEGVPKFLALARAWHRGRYDHFHSWYSDGQTLLFRTAATVRDAPTIPLQPLLEQLLPRYQATGQVLRLYFSAKPAEDLKMVFVGKDGTEFAVNSADLVNEQRTEDDEGKQRHVYVLRFPAAFPQFAIPAGKQARFEELASLQLQSPSCTVQCDIALEKIELGIFDRRTAILQSSVLRDLNIYPYGYTSHGGEGWHVHGDPGMLDGYWRKLLDETRESGIAHKQPTFPLANIAKSKGYIEDLLSELGVRAVRPERLPGDRVSGDAIHDWNAAAKVFGLYRDKTILATTFFDGATPAEKPLADAIGFLRERLGGNDKLLARICNASNCDLAQNGTLPALVMASLRRAKDAGPTFSHIWYTHFGAPTSTISPSIERPFSEDSRAAFERLSEAHYGLKPNGDSTSEPRALTASSSVALRMRKLQFVVDSGILGIERSADRVRIAHAIDPFLGGTFPAHGHAGRDLASLSFQVDDIFATQVEIENELLVLSRRRIAGLRADAGEISIVDAETASTLTFGGSTSTLQLERDSALDSPSRYRTCAKPDRPIRLFNTSHFVFANPFATRNGRALEIELLVEAHAQRAYDVGGRRLKRHVFSTDPATITGSDIGTTVHKLDMPGSGGRQPSMIAVDLSQPARHLPAASASHGTLNLNGIVKRICVTETSEANGLALEVGPFRFLTATRHDRRPPGLAPVIGGIVTGRDHSVPAALLFLPSAGGEVSSVTLDQGFYLGRLPAVGTFRVRLQQSGCPVPQELDVLVERDDLELDLTMDAVTCRLSHADSHQ